MPEFEGGLHCARCAVHACGGLHLALLLAAPIVFQSSTVLTVAWPHGIHRACGGQVHGNAIDWQKWHIRIGFNYREGLVLHNVGYVLHPVLVALWFCMSLSVVMCLLNNASQRVGHVARWLWCRKSCRWSEQVFDQKQNHLHLPQRYQDPVRSIQLLCGAAGLHLLGIGIESILVLVE